MRRRLLLALAALGLLLAVLALDRHLARVERSWAAMVAATERARDELEGLPTARPVLWGEARPGNAAEDYARALHSLAAVPDAADLAWQWRNVKRKGDPMVVQEACIALTDALAPAIQAVREGAHRPDYALWPDWSKGHDNHTLNLLTDLNLASAVVAAAERASSDGDDVEAARWLLDAAQLARDRLQGMQVIDEMVGVALLCFTTKDALYHHGLAAQLDPAALRLLADGLARLDHDLETGRGLRGDAVLTGMHALGHPDAWSGQLEYGALSAWREGFSTRLAVSKLALAKLEFTAAHREFATLPMTRRAPLEAAARARFLATAGPLGEHHTQEFVAIQERNKSLALLRMARMVLAHQLGKDPQPLADPFGDRLHSETLPDGSHRVWSDRPGRRPWEIVLPQALPASSPR